MRKWLMVAGAGLVILLALALLGPSAITATGLEPGLCASCHVMGKNVDSFRTTQSLHGESLACTDCHLPYGGVQGWAEKYRTGMRHMVHTVTGQVPEEVRLTPQARTILIDNCNRCHGDEEHTRLNGKSSCLNCHSNDPHGERGR